MGWCPGCWHRVTAGVIALFLTPSIATAQTPEETLDETPADTPELRGQLGRSGRETQQVERELGDVTGREGDAREVLASVSRELDDAEDEPGTMLGEQLAAIARQ